MFARSAKGPSPPHIFPDTTADPMRDELRTTPGIKVGLTEGERLPDIVIVLERVTETVARAVTLKLTLDELELLHEGEPVGESVGDAVTVEEDVAGSVAEMLGDSVAVKLALAEREGASELEGVGEPVASGVSVAAGDGERLGDSDSAGDTEGLMEPVDAGVADSVAAGDAEGLIV